MKTLEQACIPRASTFDPTRRDTVLDLSDLIDNRIDPADFFAENHITEGMKTLLNTYRNRLCFLTGQRAFDSLLSRARELKAIDRIIAEMHQEGVADGDPQMQQARDQLLPRFLAQFHSAIRETFTTLYHSTRDRLAKTDFLMEFKENRYDGEEQVALSPNVELKRE